MSDSVTPSPRLRPLVAALSTSVFALRRAIRWAPVQFSVLVALRVATALIPAAQVYAVAHLVDALSTTHAPTASLAFAVIIVGFLAVAGSSLSGVTSYVQQGMFNALKRRYSDELINTVADMTPQALGSAQWNDRIEASKDAIPFNLSWQAGSFITVVASALSAVTLAVSIAQYSWLAGILVIAAMIPALLVNSRVARLENELWPIEAAVSRRGEYLENLLFFQPSGPELASLGAAHSMADLASREYREYERLGSISIRGGLNASLISMFAMLILFTGAVAAVAFSPQASASAVSAAILGTLSGLATTHGAGSAYGELMASAPLILAYQDLLTSAPLHAAPRPLTAQASVTVEPPTAFSGLSHVTLTYPHAERATLKDVSLDLRPGQVTALVGENGAGKTTAIRLLMGLITPDEGSVAILGNPPTLDDFGFLFQDYGRFELTVRQYVTLGVPDKPDEAAINQALRDARADRLVASLPDGLDTQLGEQWHGRTISGGEWQRLALARVFLRDAPVWILDEPTSSVDAASETEVFACLAERAHGHSTLVVTHRANTLKYVDRIHVMAQGSIIQVGTYDELRRIPGAFRDLFERQE